MKLQTKLWVLLTSSRFKSFYWRTSMMFVAGFLAVIANNLGSLDLQGESVIVLGLVLGEVSKALNSKYGSAK